MSGAYKILFLLLIFYVWGVGLIRFCFYCMPRNDKFRSSINQARDKFQSINLVSGSLNWIDARSNAVIQCSDPVNYSNAVIQSITLMQWFNTVTVLLHCFIYLASLPLMNIINIIINIWWIKYSHTHKNWHPHPQYWVYGCCGKNIKIKEDNIMKKNTKNCMQNINTY